MDAGDRPADSRGGPPRGHRDRGIGGPPAPPDFGEKIVTAIKWVGQVASVCDRPYRGKRSAARAGRMRSALGGAPRHAGIRFVTQPRPFRGPAATLVASPRYFLRQPRRADATWARGRRRQAPRPLRRARRRSPGGRSLPYFLWLVPFISMNFVRCRLSHSVQLHSMVFASGILSVPSPTLRCPRTVSCELPFMCQVRVFSS